MPTMLAPCPSIVMALETEEDTPMIPLHQPVHHTTFDQRPEDQTRAYHTEAHHTETRPPSRSPTPTRNLKTPVPEGRSNAGMRSSSNTTPQRYPASFHMRFSTGTPQDSPASVHMRSDTEATLTDNHDSDRDKGGHSDGYSSDDAVVAQALLRLLRKKAKARDTGCCHRHPRRTRGQRLDPINRDTRPKRHGRDPKPVEISQSVTRSRTAQGSRFEELRMESYSMSMRVSGDTPQPVVSGNVEMVLPPAFGPTIVAPGESSSDSGCADVSMSDETSFSCTFSFNV